MVFVTLRSSVLTGRKRPGKAVELKSPQCAIGTRMPKLPKMSVVLTWQLIQDSSPPSFMFARYGLTLVTTRDVRGPVVHALGRDRCRL